jgi:2-aminoethylphosphonate-pyruvate transaminase
MTASNSPLPPWKDKALFTPGPLTTSRTVKQAMLQDLGSRDTTFIEIVREVRRRLVTLGQASPEDYTAIIVQGSGTFGIESVISSIIPATGKLLVLVNGAYGERMVRIAATHKIAVSAQVTSEDSPIDPDELEKTLTADPTISHVAIVHCETTTGIINPIEVVGALVKRHGLVYIVDAMSSFGAYPIDLNACQIDFLVSSSNKCIEGVPGFSFVLAQKASLQNARNRARSLALDLYAQWEGLETNGQFRFTPPTHVLLAFHQALLELESEGGVEARGARYRRNYELTLTSLRALGFKPYLSAANRGYIISSFYYPEHPNFSFQEFYERLSQRDCVIYPGKLSRAACFRIGHIGRLDSADVHQLIASIRETLAEMGIQLTPTQENE